MLTGKLFLELLPHFLEVDESFQSLTEGNFQSEQWKTYEIVSWHSALYSDQTRSRTRLVNMIPLTNCGPHKALNLSCTESEDERHLGDRPNVLFVSGVYPRGFRSVDIQNILKTMDCSSRIYWKSSVSFFAVLCVSRDEPTETDEHETAKQAVEVDARGTGHPRIATEPTENESSTEPAPASNETVQEVREIFERQKWKVSTYREYFEARVRLATKRPRVDEG